MPKIGRSGRASINDTQNPSLAIADPKNYYDLLKKFSENDAVDKRAFDKIFPLQ